MTAICKECTTLNDKIFREYDIRGVVGKDLDEGVALLLGKAFAVFLKGTIPDAKRVSVGKDVRLSSEALASNIIEGIRSSGIDVVDIGICSTPLQYFLSTISNWTAALW